MLNVCLCRSEKLTVFYLNGKYEVHFQKGIVKSAGYSLFSAILVFNSLGWYLGKHQKVMPIASECEVCCSAETSLLPVFKTPILIIGDLICRDNRMSSLRTDFIY